ncbi:MAG: hypothetical protein PHI06_10795, partial [Desulfobulbaceae bacterium]|nr:hypothetical protein [Desulfobulbaceae bacterium]
WTYNRLTTSEYSELLLHLEEWFWKLYHQTVLTKEEEIQAEAIITSFSIDFLFMAHINGYAMIRIS